MQKMPVRARKTRSRARLDAAALRLFAERGASGLTASELAEAAGVARGTVYAALGSTESLFADLAARLADEMHERVVASFAGVDDPAERLANGIRFFIRRAHEEPDWGRFIVRFAFSNASLASMLQGPPASDLTAGARRGRYGFRAEQLPSVVGCIAGSSLSAMFLVLEGHRAWREASADCAEFVLRALGVPPDEAARLARSELAPLPERPDAGTPHAGERARADKSL